MNKTQIFLFLAVFLQFCSVLVSFPSFKKKIPNGKNVPNPCSPGEIWEGVGHELVSGPGPRNKFGRDFDAAKKTWTKDLCHKDSDGDGITNGQELGDPDCVWTEGGSAPAVTDTSKLSHPGVCEPIDSLRCRSENGFLLKIDECGQVANDNWCPAVKEPGVKSVDLIFQKTRLPNNDTIYFCQQVEVPDDQEYHVIAWEPIIDNYELLHHLVLFVCDSDGEKLLMQSESYKTPEYCEMAPPECPASSFIWAFGQDRYCYSKEVGIPLGKNAFRTAVLQHHYNNPSHLSNVSDSSGIRLYITAKKRPNDGAMLGIGQEDILVPPNEEATIKATAFPIENCSMEILQPYRKYHLISMLFHMHKTGVYAKLSLRKANGQVISIIDKAVTYDRPEMLTWQESDTPILEPGDNLEIECTFKSNRNKYTYFGSKTNDEMCYAFIQLYPRPQNIPVLNIINMDDLNECVDLGNVPDLPLHDCQNWTGFSLEIDYYAEHFKMHCFSEEYPAKRCTRDCYLFLKKHNFLATPCMQGSLFRFLGFYSITMVYSDLHRIQSQTDLCLWLKEAPAEETSSSLSIHLPFPYFLLFSAIILASIHQRLLL